MIKPCISNLHEITFIHFVVVVVVACKSDFVLTTDLMMTKRCISNFGENYLFSFFVASKSDFVLPKIFACLFAKMSYLRNLVTYMTCTLALTANECFLCSPEHFTILRHEVLSS